MEIVDLVDGDAFVLDSSPARTRMAGRGSALGPILRVPEGSGLTVTIRPGHDADAAPYWHGIKYRLERRVAQRGETSYRLLLDRPGTYLYRPATAESKVEPAGPYGCLTVTPKDPGYWPAADRELYLLLDDPPLPRATRAKSPGRHLTVNGRTGWTAGVCAGEVTRLHLVNLAPARIFQLRLPGAPMKVVGSDGGRAERETLVQQLVLVPFERAIVDVLFERPGSYRLEHRLPGRSLPLAEFRVHRPERPISRADFWELRTDPELGRVRHRLGAELERSPDLLIEAVGTAAAGPLLATADEWLKVRLVNNTPRRDPRQRLVHLAGAQLVVLSRDGTPCDQLAWRDSLLLRAGEVAEVLVEASNPAALAFHLLDAERPGSGRVVAIDTGSRPVPVRSSVE